MTTPAFGLRGINIQKGAPLLLKVTFIYWWERTVNLSSPPSIAIPDYVYTSWTFFHSLDEKSCQMNVSNTDLHTSIFGLLISPYCQARVGNGWCSTNWHTIPANHWFFLFFITRCLNQCLIDFCLLVYMVSFLIEN